MYALPGQSLQACASDLQQAMAFQTGHLSLYHLTLELNTVFAKYPPTLPDDDLGAAIPDLITQTPAAGGWELYEVPAYAKPCQRSRTKLNYLEFSDYLDLRPAAQHKRSFNHR